MRIDLAHYWMGRDRGYPDQLTDEIRANAVALLDRVNRLLERAAADGVIPGWVAAGTHVASGWRPAAVNDATANAAKGSSHLTAEGLDLRDTATRELARWCLRNLAVLDELGLWMEDPRWTPSWVHLQSRPPGSGRRVFVPSTKPPLADPLPEQKP